MATNRELDEEHFIREGYQKDPGTLWLFIILFLIICFSFWGFGLWQKALIHKQSQKDPFVQVTNREFSIFSWQNPCFMRPNQKNIGYLPDFQSDDSLRVVPHFAEAYAQVPNEVLFRYHVWRRLLYEVSLSNRSIEADLFQEFLIFCPEWLSQYWPRAPKDWKSFVASLPQKGKEDLQPLSLEILPYDVRLAFQGWRNFYFERAQIRKLKVDEDLLMPFLTAHTPYERSYWVNIIPAYLKDIDQKASLSYFLRAALFNQVMTAKPFS